jgi:chorismate-pyruvate lyase
VKRFACIALVLASAGAAQARDLGPSAAQIRALEDTALVEQLNGELLASRSATLTLEAWCASHHLAADPRVIATQDRSVHREASAETRQRLAVAADAPLGYRHVTLSCGYHVLSEADNWYVPSRLTDAMNQTLETTTTPFGKVVLPLKVHRQTLSVEHLWTPLPAGWADQRWKAVKPQLSQAAILRHRALLLTPDGQPISEVEETYSAAALAFTRH